MKQNRYDDPGFFAAYSQMPRSVDGLEAAYEWPAFRALLPDLHRKRVLDLGCGFGWHCRYARRQGAASVIGVDLSENMLARAREATDDSGIEYRRAAIEDLHFPADTFDVVISSLALHYVERFDLVCQRVHRYLAAGGAFQGRAQMIALPISGPSLAVDPAGDRRSCPGGRVSQISAGPARHAHRNRDRERPRAGCPPASSRAGRPDRGA